MKEQLFCRCERCGNLVGMIEDAGIPLFCCGNPMTHLNVNATNASREKHMPVVQVQPDRVRVSVGSAPHPMEEEHGIRWVYLQTSQGGQRRILAPGGPAEALFLLQPAEQPLAVFAWCNLHGLWKQALEA